MIAVPPAYASQTCPKYGQTDKANRPTQSEFKCVACGFEDNADLVGALNILRAGHARCAGIAGRGQPSVCAGMARIAGRLAREVSGSVIFPAAGTQRSDLRAA
ncbi:zinc ribbon domain-containing protein [Acidiferrobacter sp.]|uniref:zinc ribbon domain-containing protein n=1 Tax=Acidiferrobacter sp. TaxID=1872107 RepID=UPI00344BFA03